RMFRMEFSVPTRLGQAEVELEKSLEVTRLVTLHGDLRTAVIRKDLRCLNRAMVFCGRPTTSTLSRELCNFCLHNRLAIVDDGALIKGVIMQARTLILVTVLILAACSNRTMTVTIDREKLRNTIAADLAMQLEKINYPATVTIEGETINVRVGAASLPDVRRAMCREMGCPSSEGKMVMMADTIRVLRWAGITKVKIIGDAQTLDVELEQDGRCRESS